MAAPGSGRVVQGAMASRKKPSTKPKRKRSTALDRLAAGADPALIEKETVAQLELESDELDIRTFRRALAYVKCSQNAAAPGSGWTRDEAAEHLNCSRSTIDRLMQDKKGLPEKLIRHIEAGEDAKMTLVIAKCLDEIIENPDKLEDASLRDIATTLGIINQNRQLIRGEPTSIQDVTVRSASTIAAELKKRRERLNQAIAEAEEADFELIEAPPA